MPRRLDSETGPRVREVYAELAARPITRSCTLRTECCQFRLTGKIPHLTKAEALLAAKALRATGRRVLPERGDGACPMLHPATSRCLIYDSRPFACRTHFCAAAGGPWARRDVADLIRRLEDISIELGRADARPIGPAVEECLAEL